jgi:hypothetical protein
MWVRDWLCWPVVEAGQWYKAVQGYLASIAYASPYPALEEQGRIFPKEKRNKKNEVKNEFPVDSVIYCFPLFGCPHSFCSGI